MAPWALGVLEELLKDACGIVAISSRDVVLTGDHEKSLGLRAEAFNAE